MKKILITGANSYIGTSFEKYIKDNYPNDYAVDTVDMIDGSWREKDFSGYDSVFHVAGIAHQKETKENTPLYYRVNRDLAIETTQKAKHDGAKQFVFLSSMSVYGMDIGVITKETAPSPKSNYGTSKWQAEEGIAELKAENFKVSIIRPPMVYGEGCKGNYKTLVSIARKFPVFADYKNQRSMIHVDNLSKFVKDVIDNEADGVHLPQDPEYVCTCKMIQSIAKGMGKNMRLWKILNPFVSILKHCTTKGKKAFGDLIYRYE
jgi:UDP-glucose 4-epimerase